MIVLALAALCFAAVARTQTLRHTQPGDVRSGEHVYKNGCIACHGSEGKGAPMTSTVFTRPDTFPDFTRCDQTTPEPDSTWKDIILYGGKARGFSEIMPAFGELLTQQQVNDAIAYLRSFCTNRHWPRGELNLPRAIVTEKAFPEDELVVSTAMNATGAPSFTTDVIHEQTLGMRDQIEVDVPVNYADQNHAWTSGVGDITFGLKHVVYSNLKRGSIFSVQGGVLAPTGDSNRGFGSGTTNFEPFLAFDQLFPTNTFLQLQAGADLPVNTRVASQNVFWRATLGQAIGANHGLGRLWSPMAEILASRDIRDGARVDWDVLPEMQVTVSRRQHIRAAVGVRAPFTDTSGRPPQVMFYVLWDRADGKLWEGWK
ncbi:MAG TPA: c-type cytochrome [Acidobacteriaceae bacterium]